MSVASRNQTINWCPPVHHTITPANDPSSVTLFPGFTALILGASRGIGLATAVAYAKAGATSIILTSRDAKTLDAAKKEVEDAAKAAGKVKDPVVEVISCDVTSESDTKKLAKTLEEKYGKIDSLIISAGVATKPVSRKDGTEDWPTDITELDMPDFRRTFEVNLFAGVVAMQSLIPLLEAAPPESPKSVIWLTSSSIHHFDPKLMAMGYSLSKFAAARFIEYVHEGHKQNGVTAFGIQPGSVMTDMAKYDLPKGKGWEKILIDDVNLGGGLCVWLSRERREWLSGRWVDARWDLDELVERRERIEKEDLLKFRMTV